MHQYPVSTVPEELWEHGNVMLGFDAEEPLIQKLTEDLEVGSCGGWLSAAPCHKGLGGVKGGGYLLRTLAIDTRHYLAAERYNKCGIWKMMERNNTVTREFGRLMERFDALLVWTMAIRVPEANGPYSLLRDEELDPWL